MNYTHVKYNYTLMASNCCSSEPDPSIIDVLEIKTQQALIYTHGGNTFPLIKYVPGFS